MNKDTFTLGGKEFSSRFILGSGKYSMELIKAAVENAGAQIITLAVRRTNTKKKENILDFIPDNVTLLPNTSGARDAKEAVRIARMARELGCGDFVKVEIMKDSKYLLPDNVETVKATEMLAKEGFVVLPYMYPDLYTARDLVNAGAAAVMPLASPIGSNKGLATKEIIQNLIDEIDPAVKRRFTEKHEIHRLRENEIYEFIVQFLEDAGYPYDDERVKEYAKEKHSQAEIMTHVTRCIAEMLILSEKEVII